MVVSFTTAGGDAPRDPETLPGIAPVGPERLGEIIAEAKLAAGGTRPVNVGALLETSGARYCEADLITAGGAFILSAGSAHRIPLVHVKAAWGPEVKRWEAAKLLYAHLAEATRPGAEVFATATTPEALTFAAELLMPEAEVLATWGALKLTAASGVPTVALRFGVSPARARARLIDLGCIT